MDSDESGHSESEFYYPEEETSNQMTPMNRDEVEQDRQLKNIQDNLRSEYLEKILFHSCRSESLGKYSSRRAKHTSVQVFHGRP